MLINFLKKINKVSYLLLLSIILLVLDSVSNGFINFYISRNILLLIAITSSISLLTSYEKDILKWFNGYVYRREFLAIVKIILFLSGSFIILGLMEPVIFRLANYLDYRGMLYTAYYKYFRIVTSIQKELNTVAFSSLFILLFTNRTDLEIKKSPKQKPKKNKSETLFERIVSKYRDEKSRFNYIFITVTAILFLAFGLYHLGKFMSVDELKWFDTRVPQLYGAILKQDWVSTFINDKPGILPSILAGLVNIFTDRTAFTPEYLQVYLFFWRSPLVLLGFISIPLIYFFTKQLLNKKIALIATILFVLCPTILGTSQIVNPDATLWNTAYLSLITFLLYMKTNKQHYLYISSVFLGLGLLSKFLIGIYYILFFTLIFTEYIGTQISKGEFLQRVYDLIKLMLISATVYTLLFPATWFNHQQILTGTVAPGFILKGSILIVPTLLAISIETFVLNGEVIRYIKKHDLLTKLLKLISFLVLSGVVVLLINSAIGFKYVNPQNYMWGIYTTGGVNIVRTILTSAYISMYFLQFPIIVGLVLFLYRVFTNKLTNFEKFTALSLIIIIGAFIGAGSAGGVIVNERYQIVVIPAYVLLATYGYKLIKQKAILVSIILVYSAVTLLYYAPFYRDYSNFLNFTHQELTDSWGFGGYELAQEVNSLPNAKDLNIWVDREGFQEFSISNVYWRGQTDPFSKAANIDYLILSNGGERIFRKAKTNSGGGIYNYVATNTPILKYYDKEPDFIFCMDPGKLNCIKAVKVDPADLENSD